MLDVTQYLAVLVRIQLREYVVILLLEDVHRHVEVMVLHRRRGVDGGQRRADIDHEFVVEPAVIQIVTNGADVHGQTLSNEK